MCCGRVRTSLFPAYLDVFECFIYAGWCESVTIHVSPVLGSIGALLSECWETTVGQELFKLSVIDLVALVFSVLAGDLIVVLTIRFLNCCPGRALDLEKVVSFSHSTELHGFNIILN